MKIKFIKNCNPSVILLLGSLFCLFSCSMAQVTGDGIDSEKLNDGEYDGRYSKFPNSAEVKVRIYSGKISDIILTDSSGSWIGHKADRIIPERIIEKQSTNVDAVTGATNSSRVIMNAVQDAVAKAYKK
jgi:uncharacterized protein with FMN-binding domain